MELETGKVNRDGHNSPVGKCFVCVACVKKEKGLNWLSWALSWYYAPDFIIATLDFVVAAYYYVIAAPAGIHEDEKTLPMRDNGPLPSQG